MKLCSGSVPTLHRCNNRSTKTEALNSTGPSEGGIGEEV